MKSVLQMGLVAILLAVMVPALPRMVPGGLMGLTGAGASSGERTQERTQAERDADVRRRMAIARAERDARSGKERKARKGTASLTADRRGHFLAEATINRRAIEVLVDTGASSVAMSRATAKRLGVRVGRSDFVHTASTANGTVKMAVATLDRVRIGGVELRDVEAAVLPDGALDGVLLGMSFLGRLDSFRVENGRLLLVQ